MIKLFQIWTMLFVVFSPSAAQRSDSDVADFDRARVLKAANQYLSEKPITITASHSPRSAGGLHDFFSEGDYWWPDPKNPNGPYIQRDGMSNPENFVEHRKALMRLSVQVPALAAAWMLTSDRKFADRAALHLQRHRHRLLPRPPEDGAAARPAGHRRQLPPGAAADQALRLFAVPAGHHQRLLPGAVDRERRPVDLHPARRAQHGSGAGVH